MYLIRYSHKFSKSYSKLVKGGLKESVQQEVNSTIKMLASGHKLDMGYRDHKLIGELAGYRECHIQGDLLLIYKIENKLLILLLADIGSHSDLFK